VEDARRAVEPAEAIVAAMVADAARILHRG